MIPVLMITYNRLEYTKQALQVLLNSDCGEVTVIDNYSEDGTRDWLLSLWPDNERLNLIFNNENIGIAGAMNQFLDYTKHFGFVGKIDNDTIVPHEWCSILIRKMILLDIDIIQARHPIIPAVYNGYSFDEWMKTMDQEAKDKSIYYNHFVGGTGIIFNRTKVNTIPETEGKIMGWREFQRQHPELKKAFCNEISVDLLDSHGYTDYPEYYKQTKRIS